MSSNKLSLLFRLRPVNVKSFIHKSYASGLQPYRPLATATPGHLFLGSSHTQSMPKVNLITKRFKKTGKRKAGANDPKDDDDDEDDGDELAGENPMLMDDLADPSSAGSKRFVIDVATLRLDGFAKTAFGMTRLKIEEAFYKGDLYINGERPSKKSCDLYKNDEIDLIKGYDSEDRSLVLIKRVQIVELPDKTSEQGRMKVTIDRWDNLVVKDYKERDGRE